MTTSTSYFQQYNPVNALTLEDLSRAQVLSFVVMILKCQFHRHGIAQIPQFCQLALLACVAFNDDGKEAGYYKPDAISAVKDMFCKSMQHPFAVAFQSLLFLVSYCGTSRQDEEEPSISNMT